MYNLVTFGFVAVVAAAEFFEMGLIADVFFFWINHDAEFVVLSIGYDFADAFETSEISFDGFWADVFAIT